MTPSGVGERTKKNNVLLSADWHKSLTVEQLGLYVRYRYTAITENTYDWDALAHTKRRPARDGGKDSYGVKHTAVWPKAARVIRVADAYPGMWVYSHFSFAATQELGTQKLVLADIRPSGLYSSASPSIYKKFFAAAPEFVQDAARIAQLTLERRFFGVKAYGLSPEDEKLYVYCDEGLVTATPFFRHFFAHAAGCKKAADKYLWAAALHYDLMQPAYDVALAEMPIALSPDILDTVLTIRKKWSSTNA